ncbi:hypothetical protein HZB01_04155 [Candidatus Woesearchaeota archaeon]|nr:hypothetical protein [Candidatus Woesearchaeota archaeon]
MRSFKWFLSQETDTHICDICNKWADTLHLKEDEGGYAKHCCDHCFYEEKGVDYEGDGKEATVVVKELKDQQKDLKINEVKRHEVIKTEGAGHGGHGGH